MKENGLATALPVTILGGYLGAGKTTLLNHLLRSPHGKRLAILVNEFGNIGIDADLIHRQEDDVINLAGGCVCCSFGSDLMRALLQLRNRMPRLDHVLIETSGVSLPAGVASSIGLVEQLSLNAVVVVADAMAVQQQAADRYVGSTVISQLQQADLLVLNKMDTLDGKTKPALYEWGRRYWGNAQIVETTQCRLPFELVFDVPISAPLAPHDCGRQDNPDLLRAKTANGQFSSKSFVLPAAIDLQALSNALALHAGLIVRAKGVLQDADGKLQLLQFSGGRCSITPWQGKKFSFGRLVCIGPSSIWDELLVQDIVHRSLLTQSCLPIS